MSKNNTPTALVIIAIACVAIAVAFFIILYKNINRPQSDPAPVIGVSGAVSETENHGPTIEEYYKNTLWEEAH